MSFSKNGLKVKILLSAFNTSIKIGRIMPPRTVLWEATRRCDFRCIHCGAYDEENSKMKEMDTAQVKKIIEELGNFGVKYFFVTGGEPFLRDDLMEMMSFAKSCGLETGISSNGFHIKDEHFEQIKKYVDTMQISVDGMGKTHDDFRNKKGSFETATNALRKIRENGKTRTCMTTTISDYNFDEISELYELSKDISQGWRVVATMPIGKAKNNEKLFLSKEKMNELLLFIEKNSTKKNPIFICENLGYLGRMEKLRKGEFFFCGAGILSCCIGADGKVRGCPELPAEERFVEGDLSKDNFATIWKNGFSKFREDKLIPLQCSSCKYFGPCRGGCHVMQLENMHCSVKRFDL